MLVLTKVWEWLKKYWKYILFPVGIVLGVIAAVAARRSTPVNVVAPKEVETEPERDAANAAAVQKAKEAEAARDAAIKKVEAEHAATLKVLTDEQKGKVAELQEDPDELNKFLLSVGKSIRP